MSLDENLVEHAEASQEAVEQELESAPVEEVIDEAAGQEPEVEIDEPKKKNGFERRVEKLNRKAAEARVEAEFWKQKALGSQAPAQAQDKKPQFSDYNDIDAYTDAVTDWKLERTLADYEQRQRQSKVEDSYMSRKQTFEKANPDFVDVLDDVAHVIFNQGAMTFITESDIGPAIAYELGKDPENAERISRLSATRQIAELAKIEDRIANISAAKKPSKTSTAPAPIKPVAGKGAVKTLSISDPNLAFSDFERIRNEQVRNRR